MMFGFFYFSEFLNIQQHLLETLNTTNRQAHNSYGYKRPYRLSYGSRDLDTYIPPDLRFLRDEIPRKTYWSNNVKFDRVQQKTSFNIPEVMTI